MALEDINQPIVPGHKGSGMLGTVVGGLAGLGAAIATVATAGAAAPTLGLAAGMIGAGSTIGGIAGNQIDPAQAPKQTSDVPQQQDTPPGNLPIDSMKDHPELQLGAIADARAALPMANLPQPQYAQYDNILSQAHGILSQRLGIGGMS